MTLSAADLDTLAGLHVAALPESQVSILGRRYARSFYRYIERSPRELLAVERAENGRILGAAVVSFDPHGLTRRLLLATPVVLWAVLRLHSLLSRQTNRGESGKGGDMPWQGAPELLLIFCDEKCRGTGVGTRLIAGIESILARQGVDRYVVKTLNTQDNRALAFYPSRGFGSLGTGMVNGLSFAYFAKNLAPLHAGDY